MNLNLQNIEDLIFFDKKAQNLLPEFKGLFDQWNISKRVSGMHNLGKRAFLSLFNSLEYSHVKKLEEYFGENVILEKIEENIVRHYEGDGSDLCKYTAFTDFCVSRNKDKIEVTFWR